MEILNYKAELNKDICHKVINRIADVPRNTIDEFGIINEALKNEEKISIEHLGESLARVRSNAKKRILTTNNNGLSSGGYALFGTVILLSIVVMMAIVILGIKSIIG